MNAQRTRLVLLTGIGADHRLFDPQRALFPRIETPDWLTPTKGESLVSYGRRMAETMDASEPFHLGGASFGGTVALEMARHVPAESVFLIGSCRTGRAIARNLRVFERLSRGLPDAVIGVGRRLAPLVRPLIGDLDSAQRSLVLDMFHRVPTPFIRWACWAMMDWSLDEAISVPIHHIHGTRDLLIPARNVTPDRWVSGAGHLPSLTHASAVNAFLAEQVG